ncbi:hypothetical protein AM588_10010097 [Phytophthora nicotianae]|uniref:NADH:ubiquinone oxidoreductase intermediate-associated protein 30 domain-containing protein n=1 Tax=Phytophthora nicotianae TaxID=4792 RepID=A0A0W8DFI6_PHYNI|nr:hypothetical protein AM588_10010097 [Phytophthora nicotianae]
MGLWRKALTSMNATLLSSKQSVFTGRLSMDCQPTEVGVVRSGYCAVRASVPQELLLHGYEGIAMRIMTDGREYRMNVQMESWNPFNLHMGFIRTPPNEWVDVTLPFRDFLLTAKGFVKLGDETELDPSKLKSVRLAPFDLLLLINLETHPRFAVLL